MPATRFYAPSGTTAAISPARDASWEGAAGFVRGRLVTTKLNSTFATSAGTIAGPNTDNMALQFISDPISASGAAALASSPGTVKAIFRARENTGSDDARSQMVIRVLSGDGATVRGTLLATDASALLNEWATTLTNRRFPLAWAGAGAALSAVASAVAGDRIVVEIGGRTHRASGNATMSVEYGDGAVSDCAEDETGTAQNNPFIEFSVDLFAAGGASPRRGRLYAARMVVPDVASVRPQVITKHICNETASQLVSEFDYVVLNDLYPGITNDLAAQIKALDPTTVVLRYDFPTHAWTFFDYWPTLNVNESWFLHSTTPISSTNRVRRLEGSSYRYLLDCGNVNFRNFMANYFAQKFATYPAYDGMFHDGPNQTNSVLGWGWEVAPTQAQRDAWHGNMIGYLSAIRTAISPRRLIPNSTYPSTTVSNYQDDADFLPVTDGTFIEGFGHHPAHSLLNVSFFQADIDSQLSVMSRNISQGKEFHAFAGGSTSGATAAQRERWRNFSYCLYLLRQNQTGPKKGFFTWRTSSEFCNFDAYVTNNRTYFAQDLGTPTSSEYLEPVTGLLKRDFRFGYVRVNRTSSTVGGMGAYTGELVITGQSARRGRLYAARMVVPDNVAATERRGRLYAARMVVPDLAARRGRLYAARMIVPDPVSATVAAPTNLRSTAVPVTSVAVAWDDNASNETAQWTEYKRSAESTWTVASSVILPGVQVYLYENLQPDEFYDFRVRAENAGVFSSYSNVLTRRTGSPGSGGHTFPPSGSETFPDAATFPPSPTYPSNPTFPS